MPDSSPWVETETLKNEESHIRDNMPAMTGETQETKMLRAVLTLFYIMNPMTFMAATVLATDLDEDLDTSTIAKWWAKNKPHHQALQEHERRLNEMREQAKS